MFAPRPSSKKKKLRGDSSDDEEEEEPRYVPPPQPMEQPQYVLPPPRNVILLAPADTVLREINKLADADENLPYDSYEWPDDVDDLNLDMRDFVAIHQASVHWLDDADSKQRAKEGDFIGVYPAYVFRHAEMLLVMIESVTRTRTKMTLAGGREVTVYHTMLRITNPAALKVLMKHMLELDHRALATPFITRDTRVQTQDYRQSVPDHLRHPAVFSFMEEVLPGLTEDPRYLIAKGDKNPLISGVLEYASLMGFDVAIDILMSAVAATIRGRSVAEVSAITGSEFEPTYEDALRRSKEDAKTIETHKWLDGFGLVAAGKSFVTRYEEHRAANGLPGKSRLQDELERISGETGAATGAATGARVRTTGAATGTTVRHAFRSGSGRNN